MEGEILFYLGLLVIGIVIVLTIIIWLVIHFLRKRNKGLENAVDANHFYIAFSREDSISQLLFWLFSLFLGITILSINRDLGFIISWQTIILILTIVYLFLAYYFKSIINLIFGLIALPIWLGASTFVWTEAYNIRDSLIIFIIIAIMVLYYFISRFLENFQKYKRYSLVFFVFALLAITGFLFIFSSQIGLELLDYNYADKSIMGGWQVWMSVIILLGSIIFFGIKNYKKDKISKIEVIFMSLLLILFYFASLGNSSNNRDYYDYYESLSSSSSSGWAVTFNLILFFEVIGVLILGYIKRQDWLINLGAAFMFILVFVKYFDWFFSSMNKSLFFILAGILLFVVGWFMEKARKIVINNIHANQDLSGGQNV